MAKLLCFKKYSYFSHAYLSAVLQPANQAYCCLPYLYKLANQLDIFYFSQGRVSFSYKIITDLNLWIDHVVRGLRWNLRWECLTSMKAKYAVFSHRKSFFFPLLYLKHCLACCREIITAPVTGNSIYPHGTAKTCFLPISLNFGSSVYD